MGDNKKLGKKAAASLAVGAMLTASGCSALKDYTLNGVPIEKLYADSEQVTTDAAVDNSETSFCGENPWTCVAGGTVAVGAITWGIIEANKNDPAPATTPPPNL